MKSIFEIKDISTYRSELMGCSIIWIMMLHYTFNQIHPLGFIAQYGYAGVDIFMMVSGFGLYFSLEKDHHVWRYYKKRLLRIFPTYYLIGILGSSLLYHDSILEYLFRYTTIGFWTSNIYADWYIPSLIVLYILSPFIKVVFNKKWFIFITAVVLIILGTAYWVGDKEYILDRMHFFFLYRIPAFIFGMLCAYWLQNGISKKYYYYILVAGIPFFVFLFPQHHQFYNYKYLSVFFLLPLFVIIFIAIQKYLNFTSPILRIIGKASLEIYLIQDLFFYAIINKMIIVQPILHDTITIALIIFCCLMGILCHWLLNKYVLSRLS